MKIDYLIKGCSMIAAYFAGIAPLVAVVLTFVLVDLLTGLYAAYIKKIKIESHKLRKTVEKLVFYSVAILAAYGFERNLAEWSHLAQVIAGFIASIELISIFENITKITNVNIVDKLKDALTNVFKKNKSTDVDKSKQE